MMLEASRISVRKSGKPILDDVAFRLQGGEMVGLIGPNGAGKTTLLRCLLGLDRPDAGDIRLNGRMIGEWPSRALAGQIAYLSQSAACHWPMAVERVVALGRLPHLSSWQGPGELDVEFIERSMRATDVAHLRDRQATTLSGGEQARVQLARALAVGAKLLFADEPIAGLDPGHQIQVMELLRRHIGTDRSVVIVLHDLTLAARHCTRLVLMSAGKVVADGAPEQVMTPENLSLVYGIRARIESDGKGLLVIPQGLSGRHSR